MTEEEKLAERRRKKTEAQRRWVERNPDYLRQYREANPDKVKASRGKHYAAHRDAEAERQAAYREANSEKVTESRKDWRRRNRTHIAAYNELYAKRGRNGYRTPPEAADAD
ncbi:MAG: hypothetical protein Q8R82_07790 [Hyphomonadaceae bacterium]|nr:hypothetical protein [Hyphomonadaceae bacterium]